MQQQRDSLPIKCSYKDMQVLFKEVFTELKQDVHIDFANVILVILDFFIIKTSVHNKCAVMAQIIVLWLHILSTAVGHKGPVCQPETWVPWAG